MKILIAADMEGISGVVSWDHVDPGHSEYGRFRRLMTADVNAAVIGAFEGGATEVVVADGHSNGYNILVEELDPRARLNSGNIAPFAMMQGIASDFQGVMLVGYHARAGTPCAILDHTWSSRAIYNLFLNDQVVGELGLNAALAGHFGVPVIMVTGDDAVGREAVATLGDIEIVTVKLATSRMSAECLPPLLVHERIQDTAMRAVLRLHTGAMPPPFVVNPPVKVAIEFTQSEMADRANRLPGAIREGRKVSFTAPDMPAAYTAFRAAANLSTA
jgi:D-amino peptidase